MTIIFSKEGADPQESRFFFTDMLQAVMIFGVETWVVKPCMGSVMGGFQYQVVRQLIGQTPQQKTDGKW